MKRRLTIRARLTLFYGGLFLLAGMVLLGATYALISQRMYTKASFSSSGPPPDGLPLPGPDDIPERDVNLNHTPESISAGRSERLSSTSRGAGLGLSIVRAVARAHGGDVRAEPRDGGGLVVTVSLPAPTGSTLSEEQLVL